MSLLFSRRSLLKSMLAIPCGVAGYFAYQRIKHGDGTIRTIGAPELPEAKPLQPNRQGQGYCFYALGDTGLASQNRQHVLKQLHLQTRRQRPDSIFLVGDNFYDKGVASTDDPLWQMHFEKPFAASRFPNPFYVCLGNHDYYGNIAAQVEYSRLNSRWHMPNPYYSFVESVGSGSTVQFFVLDTTPIDEGDHSTRAQVNWFRHKLSTSSADYKIVIGHHPLYTGGEHGRSRRNFNQFAKLFDGNIDLYVSGHDHDLQLHDTGRGWLHLVSGAGSKLRSVSWVKTTEFAQAAPGFARVSLNARRLGVEIFSAEKLLFSMEKQSKRAV